MKKLTKEYGPIDDNVIAEAFEGTDFGGEDPAFILRTGVLKWLVGYHSGETLTKIMTEMDLVINGEITERGRWFLYNAFKNK